MREKEVQDTFRKVSRTCLYAFAVCHRDFETMLDHPLIIVSSQQLTALFVMLVKKHEKDLHFE